MISTALAIADATKHAVHNDMVMDMAALIVENHNDLDKNELVHLLFQYSAMLSAVTASLVTEACLTESQLNDMLDTIKEMDEMGKDFE